MNKLQEPVLVVDDEADIRDLMEMTLMKMGLRVDTAAGVEEAKDKLGNKIGRASCRERGEVSGVEGIIKNNNNNIVER